MTIHGGSFDFLHLVDLLRREFAIWFREMLLSRDFTPTQHIQLACEFLLLEEIVQKQVQIPLLDELKKLCQTIEEAMEVKKKRS